MSGKVEHSCAPFSVNTDSGALAYADERAQCRYAVVDCRGYVLATIVGDCVPDAEENANLFASAPDTAAKLARMRNVNAKLVHWLTLISTAKDRGFGIDYVTAAAKSAIDIAQAQG